MDNQLEEELSKIIPGGQLHESLRHKSVGNLYHANTVRTAMTFISQGAILSRNFVEQSELPQTEQKTDDLDKEFGIWNHVFLDGQDHHKSYGAPNKYGPVLFLLDLDLLLQKKLEDVKVTYYNPWYWKSPGIKKLLDSIEEFDQYYKTGNKKRDGNIMFMFDNVQKLIDIGKFCTEIIIDDPYVSLSTPQGEVSIGDLIHKRIKNHLAACGLQNIPVSFRHATGGNWCYCMKAYKTMYSENKVEFDRLFLK